MGSKKIFLFNMSKKLEIVDEARGLSVLFVDRIREVLSLSLSSPSSPILPKLCHSVAALLPDPPSLAGYAALSCSHSTHRFDSQFADSPFIVDSYVGSF